MTLEGTELPGREPPAQEELVTSSGTISDFVTPEELVELARETRSLITDDLLFDAYRWVGLEHRIPPEPLRVAYGLRAVFMAIDAGLFAAHPQLRQRLPWADDQQPLPGATPRTVGFYQEAVVRTSHTLPDRRSLWDVHHLVHGLGRFYYPAERTRAALYAGVRLNEALAETHFYYLESLLAPRCFEHRTSPLLPWEERHGVPAAEGVPAGCPRCYAAIETGPDWVQRQLAETGLRFWDHELGCVERYVETGGFEDCPSVFALDAEEYTLAHHARVASPPFARWVEACCVAGLDYETELTAYRTRLAETLATLCVAPLSVDLKRARARQVRRVLQDVGVYLAQAAHLGAAPAGALEPIAAALASGTPTPREAWEAILEGTAGEGVEEHLTLGYDLRRVLGEPPARAIGALARDGLIYTPLVEGIRTVCPDLPDPLDALAKRVAEQPAFQLGRPWQAPLTPGHLARHLEEVVRATLSMSAADAGLEGADPSQ